MDHEARPDPDPAKPDAAVWERVGRSVSETVAATQDHLRDAARSASAALRDDDLAELADAVLAVPGVVGLDPGRLGELAAHLPVGPGRGISEGDDGTTVRAVLRDDAGVHATAGAVRDAVARLVDTPVRVVVVDVVRGDGGEG